MKFAELTVLDDTVLMYVIEGLPDSATIVRTVLPRYTRPGLGRVRVYLWDALGIEVPTSEETRETSLRATEIRQQHGDARPQFLVINTDNPAQYGMARMREQYEGYESKTFGSLIDALEQTAHVRVPESTGEIPRVHIVRNETSDMRIALLPIFGGKVLWTILEGGFDSRVYAEAFSQRYEPALFQRAQVYVMDFRRFLPASSTAISNLATISRDLRAKHNDTAPAYTVLRPNDLDQYGSARRGEQISGVSAQTYDSMVDALLAAKQHVQ